jgi:hypothetical protein
MTIPSMDPAALAALDAQLTRETGPRWDGFYADRARPCGFFGRAPDESLHGWLQDGRIPRPGATATPAALDLGCGNGRNAVFLAQQGFAVTGVDFSAQAVAWAQRSSAPTPSAWMRARAWAWHSRWRIRGTEQPPRRQFRYNLGRGALVHHTNPHLPRPCTAHSPAPRQRATRHRTPAGASSPPSPARRLQWPRA